MAFLIIMFSLIYIEHELCYLHALSHIEISKISVQSIKPDNEIRFVLKHFAQFS